MNQASAASDFDGVPATTRSRRSRFFVAMSAILLAIVLIGFAPSFYLRGLMPLPSVRGVDPLSQPLHLFFVLHGFALTLWYALLVLQTVLVANARTRWHRWIGWLGVPAALGVVVSAIVVVTFRIPTAQRAGVATSLLLSPLGLFLVAFVVLVTTAILQRKRPELHKRLMIAASVSILGPALARFGNGLAAAGMDSGVAFRIAGWAGTFVIFLLLAAMIVHDKLALRRVLPATWLSVAMPMAVTVYSLLLLVTAP
jgi:hypothetical protein